jgi:hypothetical protein
MVSTWGTNAKSTMEILWMVADEKLKRDVTSKNTIPAQLIILLASSISYLLKVKVKKTRYPTTFSAVCRKKHSSLQ